MYAVPRTASAKKSWNDHRQDMISKLRNFVVEGGAFVLLIAHTGTLVFWSVGKPVLSTMHTAVVLVSSPRA